MWAHVHFCPIALMLSQFTTHSSILNKPHKMKMPSSIMNEAEDAMPTEIQRTPTVTIHTNSNRYRCSCCRNYPSCRSVPCFGFLLGLCCVYGILWTVSYRSLYAVSLADELDCAEACDLICGPFAYHTVGAFPDEESSKSSGLNDENTTSRSITYFSADCSQRVETIQINSKNSNDTFQSHEYLMTQEQCTRMSMVGGLWMSFCALSVFCGMIGMLVPCLIHKLSVIALRTISKLALLASGLSAICAVVVMSYDGHCHRNGKITHSVWMTAVFGFLLMISGILVSFWGPSQGTFGIHGLPTNANGDGYQRTRTGRGFALDMVEDMTDLDSEESNISQLMAI